MSQRTGFVPSSQQQSPGVATTADYSVAESLIRQASTMVEQLERGVRLEPTPVLRMIEQGKSAVQSQLDRLAAIPGASSTSLVRGRNLLEECEALRQAVERASAKTARAQQSQKEREALLGGGGTSRLDQLRAQQSGIQHLSEEERSLQHARRKIQQMTSESDTLLGALRGQGQRLSSTKSKAEELLEVLGVSNQTIRSIARTNRVDAWLVYIGIALTLLLMWYLWIS